MLWSNEIPVYIYGAGLKGKLIFEILEKMDFNVRGFLDRAPKCVCSKQNVFHPNELSMTERKGCIVVCSVINVFEHRKIAQELAEQGYLYILYKVIYEKFDENRELIDAIWDAVEEMGICTLGETKCLIMNRNVAAYRESSEQKEIQMNVKEKNGYVDIVMPVLLLYTFPKEVYVTYHKRQDWLRIPYERNVYYYLYCADLFRMFEDGKGSASEWEEAIRVYKRYFTNADVYSEKDLDIKFKQHISQRYNIYVEMDKLFHLNRQFFDDYPVYVKWNEKRLSLYVRDGNNRLAFLMSKGMHNVMCRMTKEDYIKWKNETKVYETLMSFPKKQEEARMALMWMGKIDLLKMIDSILFFSADCVLCDACSQMGVGANLYNGAVHDIETESFDLLWIDVCYVYEQKEDFMELLNGYSKYIVLAGSREDVAQIENQMYGRSVISTYRYWIEDREMVLNLSREGIFE